MTTASERDRCLEIERNISRLLLSPNDDVGAGLPTRIAPADEMFRPLRRPFKARKRERKRNAESAGNRSTPPKDSSSREVPEDAGGLGSKVEGEEDSVPEKPESTEDGPVTDSARVGEPAGSDRRKQRGKEKKRIGRTSFAADRSNNGGNRQRGRGKKTTDNERTEGGPAEPRKILQRSSTGKNEASVTEDGKDSLVEKDAANLAPLGLNLLQNKKVLYLNDLERDLLGGSPPLNHDGGMPQGDAPESTTSGFEERRRCGSPTNDDWEGVDPERADAFLTGRLELFKMHHILPLKKKSGRFPRARFYCHLCHRHLDDPWYVEKHMDHDDHISKKAVKDMRLAIKNLPYPVDVQCRAIAKLVEGVAEKHGVSDADAGWRKEIVSDLETFLASSIPGVKLVLYGSSVNGFGLRDSNINVELVYGKKDDCADVLTTAARALETNPECAFLTKKFEDRVPRIGFTHKRSNLVCELCVNNANSQKTTKLLGDYASLDPRVRTLGVAFRQWARMCGLDSQDRGTLPPHAFPIMTVYFLQQCKPPVLPVLHELKKSDDVEAYVSPEELCKSGQWTCQNDRGVGQLWVEMLRFYSVEFKLNRRTVCIRRLKPVLHSEKKWNKRYIGIEDPYSRKRNLARSIPCEQMFIFLKRCLRTSAVYFHLPQLPVGPLFTSLPGPPTYTDDSECEMDAEERDASGQDEGSKKKVQTATDKAIDEDDDEDEDGASSTSSEVPDLDEQDPDLSFEETARVIANLDLGEDPGEAKSKSVKKAVPFVKPGPPIPSDLLGQLESLAEEDFAYEFSRKVLASGRNPPLICSFCQKRGHLQHSCPEQQLPKLKELPPMTRSFMSVLDDLCLRVLESISPHPQEEQQRLELLRELETFIRELYKDAKLSLFGSSCNGFGLVRSDLDICLTFESSRDGKDLDHDHVIQELAKKLQTHPDLDGIIAITTAKVPIVKFFHKPSGLEGDISLYNTLAQHNTRLLKVYSDIDERVKVLGYTFKHFAKICDIGDASRGSLSSYAYVLMTLYYLQQCKPPVIPVLQELYREGEKKPEVTVDGWNAWFFDDIDSLQEVWSEFGQNNESVGELWLGMLRFYTEEFNFKELVISIRQRKPLSRLQKMWTSKSIAIEDPFDLDHNLGSGVSRKMNTYIMKALIKGRALFGTPIKRLPNAYPDYLTYFFDRHQLTDGHPPNDRGCRACGKIGHRVKECPRRRGAREPPGSNYAERMMPYGQQQRKPALRRRQRLQTGEEHETAGRREEGEFDRGRGARRWNTGHRGTDSQTSPNADASNGTSSSPRAEAESCSNVQDRSFESSDASASPISRETGNDASSEGGSDDRNVSESSPKPEIPTGTKNADDIANVEPLVHQEENRGHSDEDFEESSSVECGPSPQQNALPIDDVDGGRERAKGDDDEVRMTVAVGPTGSSTRNLVRDRETGVGVPEEETVGSSEPPELQTRSSVERGQPCGKARQRFWTRGASNGARERVETRDVTTPVTGLTSRRLVLDKSMLLREMNAILSVKDCKASKQISHRM